MTELALIRIARRLSPAVFVLVGGMSFVALDTALASGPPPHGDKEASREYFTELKLLTHEGEEVRFYSDVLEDRVVLINGFYTSCKGFSPRQSQVLSQLQDLLGERLGKDIFIVSITVDPKHDGVKELQSYAKKFGARHGWLFLTGKPENVDWVNYRLGQYRENHEDHPGVYLLGNLRTGLWSKAPLHAMATDLLLRIHKMLGDDGANTKK